MTMIFGKPWDAPVCEGATHYPEVPDYVDCLHCQERIRVGDQGFITPTYGLIEPRFLVGLTTAKQGVKARRAASSQVLTATHRECMLVQTVGHIVGVCSCTGYDTRSREAALECLRRMEDGYLRQAN